MGDNIRLKGPLGLKQDVYDQARSEEWRKIIKIEDPQIRIKKLEEYFNIEPKKKMKGGVVKKAFLGALIRGRSSSESQTQDTAAPYRQTFNVKDTQTGEVKNIMQDFKSTQSTSSNNNFPGGIIGRLFGAIRGNKQASSTTPLRHDFYVQNESGENINIGKKDGGLIRQGYPKIATKGWK